MGRRWSIGTRPGGLVAAIMLPFVAVIGYERPLSVGSAFVEIACGELEPVDWPAAGTAFDAMLMDFQMPDIDGYQATEAARMRLGPNDLWAIALTAAAPGGGSGTVVPRPARTSASRRRSIRIIPSRG
jgi:hypothetical protein